MSDSTPQLDRLLTARLGGTNSLAAIRRACSALLAETGTQKIPVRLSPLVRYLGATIRYDNDASLGNEEATLRLNKENRIVLCVSREKFEERSTRARFSIAHEIGHIILYRILGPEYLEHCEADNRAYKFTERLCDFAASHLLMPRAHLSTALRARGFTAQGFRELANIFDVSAHALFKSIADLVPDGAVIEWRRFQRKSTEALTWRVENTYLASAANNFSSWLPRGCTLPKHVKGFGGPKDLSLEKPEARSRVTLCLGRSRVTRDTVVCLWPLDDPYAQQKFLSAVHENSSGFLQDVSQGRLMMLVGKKGRVDYQQFGVK